MIKKQCQKALNDKALKEIKSHCQLTRSIALSSLIIPQIYVSNSLCSLSNKAKNSLCSQHSRYICWERLLLLIPWDYSTMFTHWVGIQRENSNFHLCTSMCCKPNISKSLRKSSRIFPILRHCPCSSTYSSSPCFPWHLHPTKCFSGLCSLLLSTFYRAHKSYQCVWNTYSC